MFCIDLVTFNSCRAKRYDMNYMVTKKRKNNFVCTMYAKYH